ncbi:MAG: tRNA (adenosine(37)-N6)-threonylcarbamoyltransferase complex dimerization subunit type 1 TsaB [Acidobacteria bacterium]|nr:tRNA (adenosine(37)-N6)-threonylcarbamoyltransferase complex dimerization subunit type 1 TsaB [Acidobacteriota bacterium]
MIILALDTTTRGGSAAVLNDDVVLAVGEGDASRTHGERLPAELAAVLGDAGLTLEAVDLLAVASGPGAFTGLRIGLAAMQGIALTRGLPVVGVSALDVLATSAAASLPEGTLVGAWIDAARGEVFAQLYRVAAGSDGQPRVTAITDAEADAPVALWAQWTSLYPDTRIVLAGDGGVRYASQMTPVAEVAAPALLAPVIARLGRRAYDTGAPHTPHALQPLYVRRPDVEIARG